MSKRGTPKIPKSVLNRVSNYNKDPKKAPKIPETADGFLELAIEEEESADRWYSSDLLKSLRFYERAYEAYTKSIQLDPGLLDSYYNLSRLIFHVYNSFSKLDQIKLGKLENIESCFGNVLQELPQIVKYFELVLLRFSSSGKTSWDLIYNSLLIYQELIDEPSMNLEIDQVFEVAQQSMSHFSNYIEHQISELSEIASNFASAGESEASDVAIESEKPLLLSESQEIHEFEVITPALVLETIVSAYKLVQSVYESASDADEVMRCHVKVNLFVEFIKSKAEMISQTHFPNFDSHDPNLLNNISQIKRIDQFVNFYKYNDFNQILQELKLSSEANANDFEFFLSANDVILEFIEHATLDESQIWSAYTLVSQFFKKAQDILQNQLVNTSSNSDTYSSKISLLASVMINRSDIEFRRSSITSDDRNKELLLQNVKVLLKNLTTWTSKNGGLRENIIDKLNRVYLGYKANLRLCVLENGDIDTVVKDRSSWTTELQEIQQAYKN